jgi:hypothetical protein
MAVVAGPGGGTSARNKLAGVVFASWRGVQYMRSLRIPQNVHSPGQTLARRKFWCAAVQWKTLIALFKGYFDQLAELRVPLTNDAGLMPTGISGVYTGYNLHRFAYMRDIVPNYIGLCFNFAFSILNNNFTFDVRHKLPAPTHPYDTGRVWYAFKPFNTWTRGTATVSDIGSGIQHWQVDAPINLGLLQGPDEVELVFDAFWKLGMTTFVIAGSSMPDGHFNPIPASDPGIPPDVVDPCFIPA